MSTLNRRQARVAIANLEEFKGSNIYGFDNFNGTGILYLQDDLDRLNLDRPFATYYVYSYATPIAWYTPATGWYRVKSKFSMTTSHHMGLVPVAGTKVGQYV